MEDSPGSRLLAIADEAAIQVIELRHGNTVQTLDDARSNGRSIGGQVQFAAGDSLLVASGADGRIRVWDTASGKLQTWIDVPGVESPGFAVAADGKLLAVAHNQRVQLYEVRRPIAWRQVVRPGPSCTISTWTTKAAGS